MFKTRNLLYLMAIACCLLQQSSPVAHAETEDERRDRVERAEQLKRTEEVTGTTSKLLAGISKRLGWIIDNGGTARMTYTGGDEGDLSYATQDATEFTKDYELNVFINMTDLKKVSKFYSRVRTTFTERKKNAGSTRGNEWKQLEIDALYYERKYQPAGSQTTLTLGRQSASVGKGIAYGGTGDGVQVRTKYKTLELYVFGVKADRSPDDADPGNLSPPSRGTTHRDFIGGEFKWNAHPRWNPYFFFVKNKDRSPKKIDNISTVNAGGSPMVHFYEPKFYGLGGNGSITPSLSYFAEFIRARGTTTGPGMLQDTMFVRSRAYDGGLRYRVLNGWLKAYQPTFLMEWAYGSGDPDRQSTVSGASLGNLVNEDMAFRPFGGLSMGYALAPSLANIKIRKFGATFSPFVKLDTERYRNIRMSADFYKYRKDQDAGPTSDFNIPSDNLSKKEIGRELNLELTWKIFTDLTWNVRWGKFYPGNGYDTVENGVPTRFRGASEIYWRFQCSLDI